MNKPTIAIIGASSGIGAGIAEAVAKAGYPVALGARRVDQLESLAGKIISQGGQATFQSLDVTAPDESDNSIRAFITNASNLGSVIYNAGMITKPAALDQRSSEEIRKVVAVNITGFFLTTKYATEVFRRQGSGILIGIGSHAAQHHFGGQSMYGSSKGVLEYSTMEIMTGKYYPKGMFAFTIHPTHVNTQKAREQFPDLEKVWDRAPDPTTFARQHILPFIENPKEMYDQHGAKYVAQTIPDDELRTLFN